MTWNYRIIRTVQNNTFHYSIHEVYYNKNGKIEAWTEEPVLPFGESEDELREDINHFLQAFKLPILEKGRINGKERLKEIKEDQALNRGHYFEFLDRTFVAMEYIHQFLGCHPVLRKEKKLRELYQQIANFLAELYQEAGRLEFELENK